MSRTGIKELKATALGRPAVTLGLLLIYLCEMVTDILTVDVHIHREHIFALWTFFSLQHEENAHTGAHFK